MDNRSFFYLRGGADLGKHRNGFFFSSRKGRGRLKLFLGFLANSVSVNNSLHRSSVPDSVAVDIR